MDIRTFKSYVLKNYDRIKRYVWGMDGRNGECDCIGLIIGAIRLAGDTWDGLHGTNYAVRNAMRTFRKIDKVEDLQEGQLVYKFHTPEDAGYNLPSTYKDSPDQNDYYHVGVVMSVNPLRIYHCTSVDGGKKIDEKLGSWGYAGYLKQIADIPAPVGFKEMIVTGGALMLRSGAGTEYSIIDRIPNTTHVQAKEYNSVWSEVIYKGKKGYSMSQYLYDPNVNPAPDTHVSVKLDTETAKNLYYALKTALGGAVK